jgi:hypothetical protein
MEMQVVNIYMAKAPGNVANWDGSGAVWFKVGPAQRLHCNVVLISSF